MSIEALKDLEFISQAAGVRVDYTQGGGGNTSAKIDDTRMAVKASGFQLKQITPETGFVVVDYAVIRDYHKNADLSQDKDFEKEASALVNEHILEFENLPKLRPSVEAGFHSVLKRFVIHTHSVYANILTCSVEGKELMKKIFANLPYSFVVVDYINPGFDLTIEILKKCNENGGIPDVIFMENHGIVVTNDDAKKTVAIHDEVNDAIRAHFGLGEFPAIKVKASGDDFVGDSDYVKDYIVKNIVTPALFDEVILYPDQLVYLNGGADKMTIDTKSGEITYKATEKEAQTIEETLAAYLFVIDKVKANGLTIQTMGEAGISFINNWESEKYRKSMSK